MPDFKNKLAENDFVLTTVSIDQLTDIIGDCVRKEINKSPSQNEKDDLIQVSEAIKLLKVSSVTLYKWRRAGIIPFHRIASRIYFKKSELIEALNAVPKRRSRNN